MVQNRSRKTVRHFQCRDDLWALYEKMAAELECSVDYLINEAMRQYAKSRRATSTTIPPVRESIAPPSRPSGPGGLAGPPGGARPGGIAPPPGGQRLAPPPGPRPSAPPVPPPSAPPSAPPPPAQPYQTAPQPQVPLAQQQTQPPMPQPEPVQPASQPAPVMDTDPMAHQSTPPPAQPAAQPPVPATAGTMPTLYLIFNGQKIPITKEQFIIGRGLKTSDLAIKDGNISRKHAAIIYHNGAYYIKDLGSVNGIEYSGKRIDSKRIDEADMFHICDYELRFTYT